MSNTPTPAPVPDAVQAALDRLPTETLQAERAKAIDARLDVRGFDSALAKRQAAPLDAAKATDLKAHGINQAPQHGDYSKASLGRLTEGLSPEAVAGVRGTTSEWASALKFSPEIGSAVIERLATLGAEMKSLEPLGRAGRADQMQEAAINRLAAGYTTELPAKRMQIAKKEFTDLKSAATKVLDRAPNSEISKTLKDSPQFNDLWLLRTLANHGRALGLVEKKYGQA
jgi:hypothetical protein